ncbi:MAG: ATP-binding protein [Bacteroidales bacterium]|nr:ATP-binding protein [Bacteroidales bacterium]
MSDKNQYHFRKYIKDYIERDIYFQKIIPFIDKDIIKVFIGQRRVGKSYILYQLMNYIADNKPGNNIIYINKEFSDFDFITNHEELNNFVQTQTLPGRNFLFIDEVQDILNFEKSLRSLLASGKYDIYCTGSNSQLLSGDIAGHLSGRYIEIKIYSLSYLEFLQFHKLENGDAALKKYISFGGLPYLIHVKLKETIAYEYLKNVYATVLFKDVVRRHNIRNVYFLEGLVKFLSDNIGSLVSATKISKYLKSQRVNMSTQIVLNYLSYLTDALLVYKVERQNIQGKKILETNEKYYFEDWGLRNSIAGFNPSDIGKLIENIVFLHLLISGYQIHVGVFGENEIDFVCQKQNEIMYVQVAYLIANENTIQREYGNLLKIKDNYPKYVVSMDEFQGNTYEGIRHLHLREFLSRYW